MHFLFTFYSCTKSYLIFNEKDFEQDFFIIMKNYCIAFSSYSVWTFWNIYF